METQPSVRTALPFPSKDAHHRHARTHHPQVLDWMKNPVPADQYDPGCRATLTGMTCVPPSVGCGPYVSDRGTADCCSCC